MGPLHIRETHVLHGTDARKALRRGIQLPLVVGDLLEDAHGISNLVHAADTDRNNHALNRPDRNHIAGIDLLINELPYAIQRPHGSVSCHDCDHAEDLLLPRFATGEALPGVL